MPLTARSPVSEEVGAELERVAERWRQLPLDRALAHADGVRLLAQSLADRVAQARGVALAVVPDLGPATLMDQLTVMVYDASAQPALPAAASTASTPTASTPTEPATGLAADLAALRRELA